MKRPHFVYLLGGFLMLVLLQASCSTGHPHSKGRSRVTILEEEAENEPPPPPPPPPPRRPAGSCRNFFDPCACEIKEYEIATLDQQLAQPGWSTYRRREVVANISNVADYYKSEYWRSKSQDDALRALRYYDAYLGLVQLSDSSAPFAILQSIALYCNLGCRGKAQALVGELQGNYSYKQSDLDLVFRKCR